MEWKDPEKGPRIIVLNTSKEKKCPHYVMLFSAQKQKHTQKHKNKNKNKKRCQAQSKEVRQSGTEILMRPTRKKKGTDIDGNGRFGCMS